MKNLASFIEVIINSHIEETVYISEYKDMEDSEGSNLFEPGHVCEILGCRIKIEGSADETGLWMVLV
jgi:deoxycytidylate deaminase